MTVHQLILDAVSNAPVVDLADLRSAMPSGWQGAAFDQAVKQLADGKAIVTFSDCDPLSLSAEQRRGYVRDGEAFLTTIAPRR